MAFWKQESEPDHARYLDLSSQRLDGRLEPRAAQALDQHLATCESCRVRAEELTQLRAMTASLTTLPLRRSFALSPYQIARARRGRLATTFGRLASVAAAACVLTLSGSFVLPGTPVPAPANERFAEGQRSAPIAGDPDPDISAPAVARLPAAPGDTDSGAPAPAPLAIAVAPTLPNPVEAARTAAAGLGLLALGLLSGRWLTLRRR